MRFSDNGTLTGGLGRMDLWVWPLEGARPEPLLFQGGHGSFLTDNRWIGLKLDASPGVFLAPSPYTQGGNVLDGEWNTLFAGGDTWLATRVRDGNIVTTGELFGQLLHVTRRAWRGGRPVRELRRDAG